MKDLIALLLTIICLFGINLQPASASPARSPTISAGMYVIYIEKVPGQSNTLWVGYVNGVFTNGIESTASVSWRYKRPPNAWDALVITEESQSTVPCRELSPSVSQSGIYRVGMEVIGEMDTRTRFGNVHMLFANGLALIQWHWQEYGYYGPREFDTYSMGPSWAFPRATSGCTSCANR
jgi:hypothetical protein